MASAITAFDVAVMEWLRAFHAPWLDAVMTWTSAAGGAGIVWLVLALIAMCRPRSRAAAWRVLLAVMLSYALVDAVLKPAINRSRPALVEATTERGLPALPTTAAFPSGHATASFAAAVTVASMWPRSTAVWWVLAALVGYSRIYLGHHYPLDVIAGAILGIAIGYGVLGGRAGLPAVLPPSPARRGARW